MKPPIIVIKKQCQDLKPRSDSKVPALNHYSLGKKKTNIFFPVGMTEGRKCKLAPSVQLEGTTDAHTL